MGASIPTLLAVAELVVAAWELTDTDTDALRKSVSDDPCPEKWLDASFVDMGCLLFNSTRPYIWNDAVSYCQSESQPNTSLVEITTEVQLKFVQMELRILADHEGNKHWWTSGTDAGINGKWFWARSLSSVEGFIWHDGQPNSASDNCIMLNYGYNFEGDDVGCKNSLYPICQSK